jgi:hypothetical protein
MRVTGFMSSLISTDPLTSGNGMRSWTLFSFLDFMIAHKYMREQAPVKKG